MAGSMSNWLAKKLLDHALGVAPYTMPSTLYVALFTTDPTDAGTGTEVSGGGYARQPISYAASQIITDPNDSTNTLAHTSNTADVLFPVATAAWGNVTHVALYDAATTGNFLFHAPATQAKTIDVNDKYELGAGNFEATQD